jgi:hypothetical protein
MGEPAVAQQVVNRSHSARFVVPSAKDKPRHTSGQNGSRAHGTRFQRDNEGHVVETPRPALRGGGA